MEILKYPDERLKQVCKPVEKFDTALHTLLDEMAEAMYGANGVGLAAPQVGKYLRAFLVDISSQDENVKGIHEFINPEILSGSGKIAFEEGCLSLPGITEKVSRKDTIALRFQNRHGEETQIEANGLFSVAIQHENDHLDGILFIDRLSTLKRKLIRRKLAKALQS